MVKERQKRIQLDEISNGVSIILEDQYREHIIKRAIEKAGSMYQLGRIMGYMGNAPNWNIKQILSGKQGIPFYRLKRLCDLLDINLDDVEKHIVQLKRKRGSLKNNLQDFYPHNFIRDAL